MKANAEAVGRPNVLSRCLLVLLTAVLLVCGASTIWAQGDIVGWGQIVVVGEEALSSITAVAAGANHSLALKGDGSIVAWGRNDDGQCNVPSPNAGFVAVAAGGRHSLGLKNDGSIVAWGFSGNGQCTVPSPNAGFTAIAAGESRSSGLRADGSISSWGTPNDEPRPAAGFVGLALGTYHGLGLRSDGVIVAWGNNQRGECNVPPPNLDYTGVAAGGVYYNSHSLGLKVDGSIVAWGYNDTGQCNVPAPNTNFMAVAAGCGFSLGLKTNGSIVAWGSNSHGQCNVPAENTDFVAIAASCGDGNSGHCLAVRADGSVVAWGKNDYGQCNVPSPGAGFNSMVVKGGLYGLHGVGVRADGSIAAWGRNDSGQCAIPQPNANFTAVAASYFHNVGLKSDGSITAWGLNNSGECTVPLPNTGYIAVAAGEGHSLALKRDGRIVAWGSNSQGQCSVPWPNANFIAIAADATYSMGLKSDGSIIAWGGVSDGQANLPQPNTGFVALAAGPHHCLGLRSDGSVAAWGRGSDGQCSVPSPNSGFTAIAAGNFHSMGLKSDGSIVAWGFNGWGQCNVPSPNVGFTAVAAGGEAEWACNVALKGTAFAPSVTDVPADQGGQLIVSWPRHYRDSASQADPVVEYDIQRFGSDWETLAVVAATQANRYDRSVSTADILTRGQPEPASQYRIVARTATRAGQYASLYNSGYSIDNLVPPKPIVELIDYPYFRGLVWDDPGTPDLASICVYGADVPGFTPVDPIECGLKELFVATGLSWHFYRVQFTDIHGNVSELSDEMHVPYAAPVPGASPVALRIYPCQPNPFNPRTTIKFDLPESGPVRLSVFDVAGRLVRTLVDDNMPQGSHEAVWGGTDASGRDVGSGSYLARLEFGGRVETSRMGLVR